MGGGAPHLMFFWQMFDYFVPFVDWVEPFSIVLWFLDNLLFCLYVVCLIVFLALGPYWGRPFMVFVWVWVVLGVRGVLLRVW